MNDYERMACVIRHLDSHYSSQPTLEDLAAVAGLSPSHFHRLFSAMVGVTPKNFVQCLTMSHAKERLRRGESVLEAALDSGLSGPGRLHDLSVGLEAASPGELKNGGADLEIRYGSAASPFGDCLVGLSSRGICHLAFVDEGSRGDAEAGFLNEWPAARFERSDAEAKRIVDRIFVQSEDGDCDRLRAWVRGSAFQLKVWRALLRVPHGGLVTYGQLAENIGQPKAARAVGSAVARNPLAMLIPCHRVIRDTGVIGEYRWGRGRKRALIAWESAKPTNSEIREAAGV